jgi:manganese/zinc/iron transport system permease protein
LQLPVRWLGVPLGPTEVVRMGLVTIAVGALVAGFYKELQLTSFDPGLAQSLGVNPTLVHYAIMAAVSICVVSAFESVGAILVIAMLILPGVTGSLLTDRLSLILLSVPLQAAAASIVGYHLATWLDASIAACMVLAGAGMFLLAWVFSPTRGLLPLWWRRRSRPVLPPSQQVRDAAT